MRVLVTGGAGFIGSHLVDQLVEAGHEVRVFDNYSTGSAFNLMQAHLNGVRTQQGSVTWRPDVDKAVEQFRPEVVYHLAAQIDVRESVKRPEMDMVTNVGGTINMLEASRRWGVGRFVLASSAAVYGHHLAPVTEDTPYAPISPYGASKAAAEGYAAMFDRLGVFQGAYSTDPALNVRASMRCTTVILSNVYGPRQREGVGAVNIFARQLLKGEPVTLYGDGRNVRDYVYVGDAVIRLLWAGGILGNGMPRPERVLVGTGVGTTDADLLSLIIDEVVAQTGVSGLAARLTEEPARPEDIRSMVFAASLGNGYTALKDGVRATVQELRKEMGL